MPGVATDTELRQIVESFIESLRPHIRVDAVILFGSYVNGSPHVWSDIDVAVISPDFEGMRMAPRLSKVAHLMVGADPRIAPVAFSSSEYREPPRASFLREILRTGKVVYEAAAEQGAQ